MFPYCTKQQLRGKIRLPLIAKEIEVHSPDIACLQEVDNYADFYEENFTSYY